MDRFRFLFDHITSGAFFLIWQNYGFLADEALDSAMLPFLQILRAPSISTHSAPPPYPQPTFPPGLICWLDPLALPSTLIPSGYPPSTPPPLNGLVFHSQGPPQISAVTRFVEGVAHAIMADIAAFPLREPILRLLADPPCLPWWRISVGVFCFTFLVLLWWGGVLGEWAAGSVTWFSRVRAAEAAPPAGLPDPILAALIVHPTLQALADARAETEDGDGPPAAHQHPAAVVQREAAEPEEVAADDEEEQQGGAGSSLPQTPIGRPVLHCDDGVLPLFMLVRRDAEQLPSTTPCPLRAGAILAGSSRSPTALDASASRYNAWRARFEEETIPGWLERANQQRYGFGIVSDSRGGVTISSLSSTMSVAELGPLGLSPHASTPATVLAPISASSFNAAGPSRSTYERRIEGMTPTQQAFCDEQLRRYVPEGESPTRGDYSVVVNA
ncbi:hypothetical protein B0H16DRAFT_56150 [Mycena metata]|uniref:Uncharacterized protein n=1 Tax=Mycena metata TaxID=1033252 RepID=A0AAD7IE21_9AGAR|nr:hypothetical protein B0H16DRAFT_56150 [Mycena metata]